MATTLLHERRERSPSNDHRRHVVPSLHASPFLLLASEDRCGRTSAPGAWLPASSASHPIVPSCRSSGTHDRSLGASPHALYRSGGASTGNRVRRGLSP